MAKIELIEGRWRGNKQCSDSEIFEIEILEMLPIMIEIDQV